GVASWSWYLLMLRDPLAALAKAKARFGSLFAIGNPLPFFRGGRRFVMAVGAPFNREVLGRTDTFRPGGQVMGGPKGSAQNRIRAGIFMMYGEKHCSHRRQMQPPFQKSAVAGYADSMTRLIDQVIDRWRPGEDVDMYREMRTLSNWVAAHLLFGNEDFASSIELGDTIERWLNYDLKARSLLVGIKVPGTAYWKLLKEAERLEVAMLRAIERNRKATVPGRDVLSILIRAAADPESDMSEEDLVAHGVILYAASFETTANALAWTLFLIAQHPDIAKDLYDEIHGRFGDEAPDGREIDTLPLLEGVIQESMRLFPPVAYTFRSPLREVELGGLHLRPGDKVILSHYFTHRDETVFPEPNRFIPTRWFTNRPDPYQYIPFSGGPRLCLGYSFAMLELKLTIARIMQRYRFGIVPGARIDGAIQLTLRPTGGIPMTVHLPDRAFTAVQLSGNINRMVEMPV
ncbi:MAG: cytochrome P450, partial [Verrucomicrobiales bacterium]